MEDALGTQRRAKMTKAEREEYKILRMKAQEGERAAGQLVVFLLFTGRRELAATRCVFSALLVCVSVCVSLCPCVCAHACTCVSRVCIVCARDV